MNEKQFPRGYKIHYGVEDLTESQWSSRQESFARRHEDDLERLEAGRAAIEFTLDEFAAIMDYIVSKGDATQNAEGVHVGDLFYASWGWEQTNIDYFQVVALKGEHTAVLRKIGREYIGGYAYSGKCRPARNHFIGEEQYTVRTRKNHYYRDGRVEIKAPPISDGMLHATDDFAEHDYSSYA